MSNMDASVVTKVQCPIAIEWPVAENHLQELKDIPGEGLYSDRFDASIPGVTYYLSLFPNDNLEGNENNSGAYLHLEYSDDFTIKADFVIKIETASVDKKYERTFTETSGYGQTFCTTEELFDPAERYIIDGQLTIKMDGTLTVEKEMPKKDVCFGTHSDALCLGLWEQDQEKSFTVVAGGKEIKAHKSVLATRSSVFARMFGSGLKEAKENKVEIKDFSFEIVEMGIKYCYHHSLVSTSSLDDKMELLQFFDKYDIQPLKDDLEAYLITEICDSTVCRLTNAALLFNALKLEKKCTEFLQSCLKVNPISDLDILADDFAAKLFKNSFRHVSK